VQDGQFGLVGFPQAGEGERVAEAGRAEPHNEGGGDAGKFNGRHAFLGRRVFPVTEHLCLHALNFRTIRIARRSSLQATRSTRAPLHPGDLGGQPPASLSMPKRTSGRSQGCKRLIKNCITCWNSLYLSKKLAEIDDLESREALLQAVAHGAVVSWRHMEAVSTRRPSGLKAALDQARS
jgi:hypothetical protein